MEQLAYILLPIWLALLGIWIFRDSSEYELFKQLNSSEERQQFFRKWILFSFLLFGCGSLASLFLVGHADSLFRQLPEMAEVVPQFTASADEGSSDDDTSSFVIGFLIGGSIFIGVFIGVMSASRRQRTQYTDTIRTVGDVQALIPRNKREKILAFILSLNAGFSEELFFRLMLPILILLVTGSALFAISASILLFGLVHWYQGWIGVLVTSILGAVLMGVYLFSGSIWVAMAAHALIDMNGLLLMPALQEHGRSKR